MDASLISQMDLSQFGAAPLIAYYAAKAMNDWKPASLLQGELFNSPLVLR
jgi:hypothetical protein